MPQAWYHFAAAFHDALPVLRCNNKDVSQEWEGLSCAERESPPCATLAILRSHSLFAQCIVRTNNMYAQSECCVSVHVR